MKTPRIRGFTLVELMVVVAIMGIAMAIAVPNIQSLLANQRMKSAAFSLVTTGMYARGEAVKRGIDVYVKGTGTSTAQYNLNTGWCVMAGSKTCSLSPTPTSHPWILMIQEPMSDVHYCNTEDIPSGLPGSGFKFNRFGRLTQDIYVRIEDRKGVAPPRCVHFDVGGNATSLALADVAGQCPSPGVTAQCPAP